MKKRMTAILLTIAMLCTLLPTAILSASADVVLPPDEFGENIVSGACGENLTWTLDLDTGALSIEGSGPMDNYEPTYYTPWYAYSQDISTIVVGEGVTSIGEYAFANLANMTSVSLPESLTEIGARAFAECSALESVVIPGSVAAIRYGAFADCTGLTSVTIPNGIERIESFTFSYCTALREVTIPDSVTYIAAAFRYCTALERVTIPGSVETIGVMAFIGCSGLTELTIEEGVTLIDRQAFSNCASLTEVTIPDTVTEIGLAAFSSCTALERVTVPGSVTRIGNSAFKDCTGLTELTLEEGVTFVETAAFAGCSSLQSVTLPEGMPGVGYGVFSGCTALQSVTIPVSVTEICAGAFENCAALTDVYYCGSRSQWYAVTVEADNECLTGATFHFAAGSGGPCGEDLIWEYADGVLTITGTGDMNDCGLRDEIPWAMLRDEITTVNVSEGCTSIGSLAFSYLPNLTSVSLPDSVARLGRACFSGCTSLTTIDLPENLTNIGDQVFDNCTSLQSVVFPEGVTSICFGMFINCDNLASVALPESLTSIGEAAFYGCYSITSIAIPHGLTEIGNDAFLYCDGLTDVYYGGTAAEWGAIVIGTDNECLTGANIHFADSCEHEHAHPEHKDATCTEPGYDRMICDDCGEVLSEEVIPALGHDIAVDEAVAPTCTATGLTAGEHCRRCDYKVAQEIVPMIAHTYKDGVCTVCGAKDPDYKPVEPTKFNDVKETAWYYDAVNYAVSNGLMNGVGNNNFAPNSPMTRAMLVTVLWRYENSPKEGKNEFTDVPDGQWYTDAVAWAAANGIVGGVGNGKFDPNGNITREQMAAILYRYAQGNGFDTSAKGDLSGFPDKASVSAWATDAIAWTVAEGIIGGSDGKLLPQGNATRAQVATILMRFIEKFA